MFQIKLWTCSLPVVSCHNCWARGHNGESRHPVPANDPRSFRMLSQISLEPITWGLVVFSQRESPWRMNVASCLGWWETMERTAGRGDVRHSRPGDSADSAEACRSARRRAPARGRCPLEWHCGRLLPAASWGSQSAAEGSPTRQGREVAATPSSGAVRPASASPRPRASEARPPTTGTALPGAASPPAAAARAATSARRLFG